MPAGFKNSRKLWTNGQDPNIPVRLLNLENNEYKITYYEVISGTSGSLTLPTGATINAGEFGLSGNCILSKIDGSNKPTFESPKTSGGVVVTASLDETDGSWVASGTYTDSNVALIYSIKIKAINYSNLTYDRIIETVELTDFPISQIITNGVTNKAPSEDAVYDALALKKDTVCINCGFAATNFADSTTYYFGVFLIGTATSAANTRNRFNAPFTGNVASVYSRSYAATPTSNEDVSFVLHNLTQGTSVTLGNIQFNATQINTYTGLTLACNEGDLMEYRLIVPALATNGAASQMQVETIFTKS